MTITELRKEQYEKRYREAPYISNWKRNPYTWFKAGFYIELSSILIYFCLKTKIKPNIVSVICIINYIIAGLLLSIPNNLTIITAVFIFFTNPALDWTDGPLARITGQKSLTGHILDFYEAHLGLLCLQISLGFYVANRADLTVFYYLTSLIPFFYAANLYHISTQFIIDMYQEEAVAEEANNYAKGNFSRKASILTSFNSLIDSILDGRARNVDFLCVLIVIELYTHIFVVWIIFLFFLLKAFLQFCAAFHLVAKGGWIEYYLNRRIGEIISLENKRRNRKN